MSYHLIPTRWHIAAAIMLAPVAFALPAEAQSMDCPMPHALHGAGVLRESPVQIAETGSFLADTDRANHVAEVVADLRKRYRGVSNAEIENYLVTAYCPVVARLNGLSVTEQRARLDQFAHLASVAVYGK
jgi:hypothetical protein